MLQGYNWRKSRHSGRAGSPLPEGADGVRMPEEWNSSELLYQSVLDALPEGILYCDANYIVRKVNQCYASLLGGDVKTILGRPLPDLNPLTRAPVVIKNGRPEMGDLCTLPLFGDNYKFVVNRIPVRDSDGAVTGMVSHILFTDPAELRELNRKIDFLAKKLKHYNRSLKSEHNAHYDIGSIIGDSAPMRAVKKLIQNYAADAHPVLILGRTGTGKELTAHALHVRSNRAAGPFVSINCAAIPKELFEAELFGYAPGAFSDARKEGKIGQIELANTGTLFLDEIGDIPLHAQVKLLRVLEEKRITRLGDVSGREVDFRLITATNRDLQDMISQGNFREDLYYRINTLTIRLPPLRARPEDILPLARHILSKIGCPTANFTDEAVRVMEAYAWPGNVRQLFNTLVHATLHQSGERIDARDLPHEVTGGVQIPERHSPPQRHHDLAAWLSAQEAGFLTAALQENQGNVTLTARQLDISRVTLYAKLKKYGIRHSDADTAAIDL